MYAHNRQISTVYAFILFLNLSSLAWFMIPATFGLKVCYSKTNLNYVCIKMVLMGASFSNVQWIKWAFLSNLHTLLLGSAVLELLLRFSECLYLYLCCWFAVQLFRKDLISAMKLPDSEPLSPDEYWVITDQWKQEWERGVQVPVNPDSLPQPSVTVNQCCSNRSQQDFKLWVVKFCKVSVYCSCCIGFVSTDMTPHSLGRCLWCFLLLSDHTISVPQFIWCMSRK